MGFNQVILWIMAIGAVIGGIDFILGNKFGLGAKFEEGLNNMGPLAIGMVGILCLAPAIAGWIGPVITPFFTAIGIDPSVIASLFSCDMGGYPLGVSLAADADMGLYNGMIVASMLGCAITFIIPVGLSMIEKYDQPFFAKGVLIGLITVPFGSFVGGLAAGYDVKALLINTIPVLIISILLALGIRFIPTGMIKGCTVFGKIISTIVTIGLIAAGFEYLTGVVVIPGMDDVITSMGVIGSVAVVLMGTLPVMTILLKVLDKPLKALGAKTGMNSTSIAGLIIDLANGVPVYVMYKDMDPRGKVLNIATMVPIACILGDHLAFCAGVEPGLITPLIIGKLVGGIIALVLGFIMTKDLSSESAQSAKIRERLEAAAQAEAAKAE